MIVIATNVLSEMMQVEPNPEVLVWGGGAGRLHTTAITVAEVSYGISRLPSGRRRSELASAAERLFADFGELILPFDTRAARAYGEVVVKCERAGRPIAGADAQIASICTARGAVLATRNTSDFLATDLELVDPWRGGAR